MTNNSRDVVFKSILIEPEGFPISKTQSALLCVSGEPINFLRKTMIH